MHEIFFTSSSQKLINFLLDAENKQKTHLLEEFSSFSVYSSEGMGAGLNDGH